MKPSVFYTFLALTALASAVEGSDRKHLLKRSVGLNSELQHRKQQRHRRQHQQHQQLLQSDDPTAQKRQGGEPFLGSIMVMDSCQYKMCGADYFHEFGYGKLPKTKSCSGECDAAAYRLVSADGFKRDFLWGQCSQMCSAKYKQMDYKGYAERLTCMDECFSYYEYISPNRDVARSCIHSACGEERLLGGQHSIDCFESCTRHVRTSVPEDDWIQWSRLLATADCTSSSNTRGPQSATVISGISARSQPAPVIATSEDQMSCADEHLWRKLTSDVKAKLPPDVLLLCINAMCDNDVKCGKKCLNHVSNDISPEDLPRWRSCTYSTTCANQGIASTYEKRENCADRCLDTYKAEVRKAEEEARRRRLNEAKKKEAEALLGQTSSATSKFSSSSTSAAIVSTFSLVLFNAMINQRF